MRSFDFNASNVFCIGQYYWAIYLVSILFASPNIPSAISRRSHDSESLCFPSLSQSQSKGYAFGFVCCLNWFGFTPHVTKGRKSTKQLSKACVGLIEHFHSCIIGKKVNMELAVNGLFDICGNTYLVKKKKKNILRITSSYYYYFFFLFLGPNIKSTSKCLKKNKIIIKCRTQHIIQGPLPRLAVAVFLPAQKDQGNCIRVQFKLCKRHPFESTL